MKEVKKQIKGGFRPISDAQWAYLQASNKIPGRRGTRGRCGDDDRKFINAVLWLQYTGSPLRALPQEFGKWGTVYTRLRRWTKADVWKAIFKNLSQQANKKTLMIDSTVVRAHQHSAGSKKRKIKR